MIPEPMNLDEIEARINQIRRHIELRGIFARGHEATRVELQERHDMLETGLRQDIADLEAHGHQVSKFEQMVLIWANKLNF